MYEKAGELDPTNINAYFYKGIFFNKKIGLWFQNKQKYEEANE